MGPKVVRGISGGPGTGSRGRARLPGLTSSGGKWSDLSGSHVAPFPATAGECGAVPLLVLVRPPLTLQAASFRGGGLGEGVERGWGGGRAGVRTEPETALPNPLTIMDSQCLSETSDTYWSFQLFPSR